VGGTIALVMVCNEKQSLWFCISCFVFLYIVPDHYSRIVWVDMNPLCMHWAIKPMRQTKLSTNFRWCHLIMNTIFSTQWCYFGSQSKSTLSKMTVVFSNHALDTNCWLYINNWRQIFSCTCIKICWLFSIKKLSITNGFARYFSG